MGLFSFLQRPRGADKAPAKAPSADEVQRARTRARQRLIGALVLLGVGVIGFPLVFETQPRPIPVDIPIEIPRKDSAPPLVAPPPPRPKPAAAASAPLITETVAEAGRDVPPASSVASAPQPAREPIREPVREVAKPVSKPAAKADDGRFVVQVGAFADAGAARDTRLKVEKLGLKTYTQVVETDAGKRIRVRVGPFASRDEADKVAGKIKSAGLPSAIVGL